MKQHFTTREVAKILSLPEWRIRSCVRAGFLAPERGPDRRNVFSFHDLLLLRTTKGLLNAHVPLGRIRRILQSLKKQLPEDKKLWNVSVFADGKHVVVKNGAARWRPDSGQFLFNFAAQELAQKLNLPQRKKAPQPERSADDWFDLACDLESSTPSEARQAYERALDLDPGLAEAHVNLGRLHHEQGSYDRAEGHYRAAIEKDPEYALAHFNLGVLLEDCRRPKEAAAAYHKALAYDSTFADAHYNLALIYEAAGKREEAFKHLWAARKIYRGRR
ncbi:MAG TPA: tetratricopeptide repeat protein [Verrucomicrobiae bacterium]|nr:tetratricopeptide repeat protein [Verrucomicrobiae bacterium]